MENVAFFQKLAKTEGESACKQCCQVLLHETYAVNEYVFRQDDPGDRFYIILEGACGVLIETDRAVQEVRTYRVGDSFGELALIQNQPRAASIQCKALCHFAVLRREDYEKTLQRVQKRTLDENVEFLLGQPMFKAWSRGAMVKLSYYFNERNFTWKQAVYRAGDPANDVFFIKKGEFRLLQDLPARSSPEPTISLKPSKHPLFIVPSDKSKKQFEIASLANGEVIGLEEVFNSVPRTCTCICYSGDAETLVISKENFFRRIKNEEKIAQMKSLLGMRDKLRSQRLEKREQMRAKPIQRAESHEGTNATRVKFLASSKSLPFGKFLSIIESTSCFIPTAHPALTKSLRSSSTWDNILRKTLTFHKSKPKPKPSLVVNIHTHSAKLLEAQRLQSSITTPRSTVPTTPVRSATLVPLLVFPADMSINGSQGLTPRSEWKMKQSRHSLFRPMRSSRF
jgi:CRP-like cAMP-binding protein